MFRDVIRTLRLENDMSQADLAEVLKVTRQSISKYEKGTAEPSLDKLAILVDYFDVSYDYLLADTEEDKALGRVVDGVVKPSGVVRPSPSISDRKIKVNVSDPADPGPKIIVPSKIDPEVKLGILSFEVVEKYTNLAYKPDALLVGHTNDSFFKDKRVELAWYKTIADAETEKEALEKALKAGNKFYELKYDVPVRKRGFFSVQIDEEEF